MLFGGGGVDTRVEVSTVGPAFRPRVTPRHIECLMRNQKSSPATAIGDTPIFHLPITEVLPALISRQPVYNMASFNLPNRPPAPASFGTLVRPPPFAPGWTEHKAPTGWLPSTTIYSERVLPKYRSYLLL